MKSENKCKRKGIKVLPALEWWKMTKKQIGAFIESYRERKSWKTFEKVSLNTWKILYTIFDRSKMLRLIQHQSSTDRNRQGLTNIFNHNFDWSKNNFDRSKFWKNQFFEKQSKIMQKLLKALNFMNHMHEYEMKCFSKHMFWTQFSQN